MSRDDGDRFARDLYAAHGKTLFQYALRLCDGDRQRAEEVVQDVVVRAWRAGENNIHWLLGVTRNRAVDYWRSRQRRERHEQLMRDDSSSWEYAVTRDASDRVLDRHVIVTAMAGLPPGMRDAIALLYWERMSVPEAALVLGVKEGTVKSRARRGMARLRQALAAA